jgi:hypothetical protein
MHTWSSDWKRVIIIKEGRLTVGRVRATILSGKMAKYVQVVVYVVRICTVTARKVAHSHTKRPNTHVQYLVQHTKHPIPPTVLSTKSQRLNTTH